MSNKQLNEEQIIEHEFNELIKDYLSSNHRKKIDIIERAYKFAKDAHSGALRQSGEAYILHPIAVARITCTEVGLGSTSICAALLHDVVEDTEYTIEDIENLFGKKIAQLVDGLTKIAGRVFSEQTVVKESNQAEYFRKLLITMSEDIRVVLIKIADRLHNMRTLSSLPEAKRHKITGETLYIYAPIAHRLGLFSIKSELEDISFKYENSEVYNEIQQKIIDSSEERDKAFEIFAQPIKERLNKRGINYEMKARVKSVYSIWKKMDSKQIPFEQVYDLYAVRIIFDPKNEEKEKDECWEIFSTITETYKTHPERTRNWITQPKANGYQALHLTVMSSWGTWVEVQIRSKIMNEIAEKGFAAHWKYKAAGRGELNNSQDDELDSWIKTIKEILENPDPNALDVLDTIKLNLYSSEIFVFTPKGDIKTLPNNATALDFAFNLHSYIGEHCIAAKVNHKLVTLNHPLKSGDQVEILTSKTQQPKEEWLQFTTTARGKNRLMEALRKIKRNITKQGEGIYKEFINNNNISDKEALYIEKIMRHFDTAKKDELFYLIGNGSIVLDSSIVKTLSERKDGLIIRYLMRPFTSLIPSGKNSQSKRSEQSDSLKRAIAKGDTFKITSHNKGKSYIFAKCCNPIHGDSVIGYIGDDDRVIVHSVSCKEANKLKSTHGDRIIAVSWNMADKSMQLAATISINGIDKIGVLNSITSVITQNEVDIIHISFDSKDGLFAGKIKVYVTDTKVINSLCANLKKIREVKSANRVE